MSSFFYRKCEQNIGSENLQQVIYLSLKCFVFTFHRNICDRYCLVLLAMVAMVMSWWWLTGWANVKAVTMTMVTMVVSLVSMHKLTLSLLLPLYCLRLQFLCCLSCLYRIPTVINTQTNNGVRPRSNKAHIHIAWPHTSSYRLQIVPQMWNSHTPWQYWYVPLFCGISHSNWMWCSIELQWDSSSTSSHEICHNILLAEFQIWGRCVLVFDKLIGHLDQIQHDRLGGKQAYY